MEIIEIHFPEIGSTNSYAKEHLTTFDRHALTLVTADTQLQGRGRFGRGWVSPKDNLYASFVFFAPLKEIEPIQFTHLLALSAVALLNKYGLVAKIKWPNDILIDRKKIAGILCETTPLGNDLGVVLGIGLNVNMSEQELAGIDQSATSLKMETGREWKVKSVMQELKMAFVHDLEVFLKEGFYRFQPVLDSLLIKL